MPWITKGKAEWETTELGKAAFNGDMQAVEAFLQHGVSWEQEGARALNDALIGNEKVSVETKLAIAEKLLAAGSPFDDQTYGSAFHHGTMDFLKNIPSRPDLINAMQFRKDQVAFLWAILDDDFEKVKSLCRKEYINESLLITHGLRKIPPIFYAIRHLNLNVIQLIVEAGAKLNVMDEDGKSPLRLVAENPSPLITTKQRNAILKYLESKGAHMIPAMTWWERTLLRFGFGPKVY